MAIKSTIFKANVQIADIDHNYYADHALTLARHPSETDERMMVRLVALSLQAHQLQDMCNGDGVLNFLANFSRIDVPHMLLIDGDFGIGTSPNHTIQTNGTEQERRY
ncbi:MAG: hypothetical protein EB125_04855, partial [Betaproteobacteria bacterium]|nr:hypothetical protein [Betaproteobacteria bacterium]